MWSPVQPVCLAWVYKPTQISTGAGQVMGVKLSQGWDKRETEDHWETHNSYQGWRRLMKLQLWIGVSHHMWYFFNDNYQDFLCKNFNKSLIIVDTVMCGPNIWLAAQVAPQAQPPAVSPSGWVPATEPAHPRWSSSHWSAFNTSWCRRTQAWSSGPNSGQSERPF